jgi:hypothetical protein
MVRSALLAALVLAPGAHALQDSESGAAAPAGTWYTRGGCAARTGVTLTPPAGIAPLPAWTYQADGEIAGEPLVWDDRVVIEVQRGGDRRVEWLDLTTGARLAQSDWIPGAPLAPCLWGGNIALRSAAQKAQILAPRERSLEPIWTYASEGEIYSPLYIEGSVYVRSGDGIERLDPPATSPAWRVEGDFRSELVLRGDRLWAISYDKKGVSWLYEIDRASGNAKKLVSCGQHQGQRPERGNDVRLGALVPQLFVYHALPITLSDLTSTTVGMVDLTKTPSVFQTAYFTGQAVDCGDGWIGQIPYPDRGTCWIQELGRPGEPPTLLAGNGDHTEFLGDDVPLSIAGNAALIGARAFDLETKRVLWSRTRDLSQRPIPVRSGVLLAEKGGKLSALLSDRGVAKASRLAATKATPPALDLAAARALLRDGSVVAGKFKRAATEPEVEVVSSGGVKSRFQAAQCLLIEQADGALVWCAEPGRYALHARTILERTQIKAWGDLAREAIGTKDPEVIGRYVKYARDLGSADPDLAKTEKARLELIAKPQRVNKARVTELAAREAELVDLPAQGLLERARKLPAGASPALRVGLITAALAVAPDSPSARAALAECVPAAEAGAAGWSMAEWLALAAAAQSGNVRPIEVATAAAPATSATPRPSDNAAQKPAAADSARLAALVQTATKAWKRELKACGDERLLVVAAEPRFDTVERVIRWADLVCTALESLYDQPIARPGGDAAPLSIWLHPDQESYNALVPQQTPDLKRQPETAQAWYDWEREAVHVVLPSDPQLAASTRAAFAHALAHQWMRTRMPGVEAGLPLDDEQSGWWIAAGMATFVEELGFDEERREFGVQTGLTPSFDVIGQLGQEGLLAWSALYDFTRARTARLDSRGTQVIALRLRLGPKVLLSQLQLFYLQAAATVHYLYSAEDGRYRSVLLQLVDDWHSKEHKNTDVMQALGISGDELGKRVMEWTRELTATDAR